MTLVRRRAPFLISRLFFVLAVLVLIDLIFSGAVWYGVAMEVVSTLTLPVRGASLATAVLLLILGGALARRKKIGFTITLIYLAGHLLNSLVYTVVLTLLIVFDEPLTSHDHLILLESTINLLALGTIFVIMVRHRNEFSARRPPGSFRKALVVLIGGLALTTTFGIFLVWLHPGELRPRSRLGWLLRRMLGEGVAGPLPTDGPPTWIGNTIGVLVALTLLAALYALMRSQRRAAVMAAEDEPMVRALVAEYSEDSLAYFNTRRDKSVVFAAAGRAGISYRVELGVCLASSDPLGEPDHWPAAIAAWQELVRTYGWTPAVIGASEAGAKAYARAGLRVLQLGDEAILHANDFHLDGRDMRPVRQAVHRLEKMGYRIRVRRHDDVDREEWARLVALVEVWRDSETERGFSMALGRLGDPADGSCLLVEALFPPDHPGDPVAGVLSYVPWGTDGLSLDVMRRHPEAGNGVTELMVTGLLSRARELGIRRVSLNFAVFRSAFEEGARIGAGPILRLWRRLLLVASRWWQIESLFRSNVKYRPDWYPRFLCFAETRDIALVGAASGVAEGFIDLPSFLRTGARESERTPPSLPENAAPVALPAPRPRKRRTPSEPEQHRIRRERRE